MSDKHYINAIGVLVRVDCGEDISLATNTKLYVRKPDGTEVEWDATIYNSNYLEYTSQAGDLDRSGFYRLQSGFTLGTWTGKGNTAEFAIYSEYA